jgi:hypothetical protein
MTIEGKEKALPGYKSLAEVQKKQIDQNDTIIKQNRDIINLLGEQLTEQKTNNKELVKINKYKEGQKKGDIKYRTHDVHIKRQSTYLNVFGLLMAGVALAISIKANGIEPVLEMISGFIL